MREDAQRLGMPLIVWSYPRGAAIDDKGGKDSYAVDYAAPHRQRARRRPSEGELPLPGEAVRGGQAYLVDFSPQQAIDAVVRSANRTLLLVSGGERPGDEAMLEKGAPVDGGRAPPG